MRTMEYKSPFLECTNYSGSHFPFSKTAYIQFDVVLYLLFKVPGGNCRTVIPYLRTNILIMRR